jgi:hypothetical protein
LLRNGRARRCLRCRGEGAREAGSLVARYQQFGGQAHGWVTASGAKASASASAVRIEKTGKIL